MEDYTVLRAIGKGSFGKVYLVRHTAEGKQYVMKVIKLKGIPAKEREACRNEVMLMQRLSHPNIVAYKDSFFASGRDNLCIVMTYCDGGDLSARLADAKGALFKEDQIMHWFVQMALAIHYMHENKVLHRDIKAQNIFLLGNGRLVLGDLGISKVLDGPVSFASTQIGTPYYMSPELFKNKPYNHKSDVWALGCVLYELCTLQHPFDATSLSGLAQKIARGVYAPINPKYSQSLRALIASMLSLNAASRPSMSDILTQPYIKKHIYNFLKDIASRSVVSPLISVADAPIGDGTMMFRAAVHKVASAGSSSAGTEAMTRAVAAGLGPHAVNLQSQLTALGLQPVVAKALEDAASGSTAALAFGVPAPAAAPAAPPAAAPAVIGAKPAAPAVAVSAVSKATPASILAAPAVAAPVVAAPPAADPTVARKLVKEQQAALDREEERRRAVEQALAKLREEKELRAKQREEFRRKAERIAQRGGAAPSPAIRAPAAVAPAAPSSAPQFGALPPGKIRVVPVGVGVGSSTPSSVGSTPQSVASAPAASGVRSAGAHPAVDVRGKAVPMVPAQAVASAASTKSDATSSSNKAAPAVAAVRPPVSSVPSAKDSAAKRSEMEKKRVAELDAWDKDRAQRAHAKAIGISALHAASPQAVDSGSASGRGNSRGKQRAEPPATEPVSAAKKPSPAVPVKPVVSSTSATSDERQRRTEADRQARDDRKAREDARWARHGDGSDGESARPLAGGAPASAPGIASSKLPATRSAPDAPKPGAAGGLARALSTPSMPTLGNAGQPPLPPSNSAAGLARVPSVPGIVSTGVSGVVSPTGGGEPAGHVHRASAERVSPSMPSHRVPSPSSSVPSSHDSSPTFRAAASTMTTSDSFALDAYLPDNFDALSAKDKVLARKEAVRRAEEDKQRHILHAAALDGQSERRKAQFLAREQYRGVGAAIAGALPINNRVLEDSMADATELVATLAGKLPGAQYPEPSVSKIDSIPEDFSEAQDVRQPVPARRPAQRPYTAGSELPSESKLDTDLDADEPLGSALDDTDPAMMTAISEDSAMGAPEMPTPAKATRRFDDDDEGYPAGEIPDSDSEDSAILAAAVAKQDDGSDTEGADEFAGDSKLDDVPRGASVRVVPVRGRGAVATGGHAPPGAGAVAVPPGTRRRPQIGIDSGVHDDDDIRAQEEMLRSELMRSTMRCNNLRASLDVARKYMADLGMPPMRASIRAGTTQVPPHASLAGGTQSRADAVSTLAAALPKPAYPSQPAGPVVRDERPIRPSADPHQFGGASAAASVLAQGSTAHATRVSPAAGAPLPARSVLAPSAAAAAAAGGYLGARPPLPTASSLVPASGSAAPFSEPAAMYSVADDEWEDDELGDEDGDLEGGVDFRHVGIPEETESDVQDDSRIMTSRGSDTSTPVSTHTHTRQHNPDVHAEYGSAYVDLPTRMEHLRKQCISGLGAATFDYVYECVKAQLCVGEAMDAEGAEDGGAVMLDLADVRAAAGPERAGFVDEVVRLVNLEQTFL